MHSGFAHINVIYSGNTTQVVDEVNRKVAEQVFLAVAGKIVRVSNATETP
jgi:hypothetical protein